jgi:hypothetical protein
VRRSFVAAHQERALRGNDASGNALSGADTHRALDVVGEANGMGDHEVVGPVVAEHERGSLAADQLRGDTKDRVEQILCSAFAEVFHLVPHSRVAARTREATDLACFPVVTSLGQCAVQLKAVTSGATGLTADRYRR